MKKLNPLEEEIIHHLANNVQALDLNFFVSRSKITRHDRRMNAAILDLVDRKLIFMVTPSKNSAATTKYHILKLTKHGVE